MAFCTAYVEIRFLLQLQTKDVLPCFFPTTFFFHLRHWGVLIITTQKGWIATDENTCNFPNRNFPSIEQRHCLLVSCVYQTARPVVKSRANLRRLVRLYLQSRSRQLPSLEITAHNKKHTWSLEIITHDKKHFILLHTQLTGHRMPKHTTAHIFDFYQSHRGALGEFFKACWSRYNRQVAGCKALLPRLEPRELSYAGAESRDRPSSGQRLFPQRSSMDRLPPGSCGLNQPPPVHVSNLAALKRSPRQPTGPSWHVPDLYFQNL